MLNEKRQSIIFLDSGIGGLLYLQSAMLEYPQEFYIHIADSMNFPYGEKTKPDLYAILTQLASIIKIRFNPKALVIACNTATLVAMDLMKEIFSCPIIGIEPQIQDIQTCTQVFPIAILATETSITQLSKSFQQQMNNTIFLFPASILAHFVENSWILSSNQERIKIIKPFIKKLQEHNIRTLILACTHFVYLKDTFQYLLPHLKIIDYLRQNTENLGLILGLEKNCTNISEGILYQTKDMEHQKSLSIAKYFNLLYAGVL